MCTIARGRETARNLIEHISVTVFWSHYYLSSCLYSENVDTIARGRDTARKSDWGNLSNSTLVPLLPQFLPILFWRLVYYSTGTWKRAKSDWANLCHRILVPSLPQFLPIFLRGRVNYFKGRWNRVDVCLSILLSQYSCPIITSLPAYTVKTWVILQGKVKPHGRLIEQTSATVIWSHHYLCFCLYFCEEVCTIATGRQTPRTYDWENLSNSILVQSLLQFLHILLWRRVYYWKGTSNRTEV